MFHLRFGIAKFTRLLSRLLFCRRRASTFAAVFESAAIETKSRTIDPSRRSEQLDEHRISTLFLLVGHPLVSDRISFGNERFDISRRSIVSPLFTEFDHVSSRRSLLRSEPEQSRSLAKSSGKTSEIVEEISAGRRANLVGKQRR